MAKVVISGREFDIDDDALKSGLESGIVELNLENVVLRTTEEDSTFQENLKKDAQSLGIELGRKNVLKSLGIEELNGAHKSDDKTLEVLNGFVQSSVSKAMEEAKIEPNKKVQELSKDLETLRNTVKEKENAYNSLKDEFFGYKKNQKITSTLSSLIPDNVIIDKSDMLTILSNKIKVDLDESGNIFALNNDGSPIKNPTTLEPLPIDSVIKGFFDNNPTYLKPVQGGAGGGDSTSGKGGKQTIEEFQEEMKKAGHALNSPGFVNEMNSRIKAGLLDI